MDRFAKAVNWLATGDVQKELTTRCLITKLVIFIIRVITVAILLYIVESGAANAVVDIMRAVGIAWVALVK